MRRRTVIAVGIVTAAVVAGAAIGVWALVSALSTAGPECTVPRPPNVAGRADETAGRAPLTLDAVQLQHASTIDAVGLARGLPERARTIALAAAWQESSLRNIDHGDRDSLGLFQQRPTQGWGDPEQIMDPVYAANKFYDALLNVPDWQQLSLTEAAQSVQRSGYPEAYAKWEDDAHALAVQLGGTEVLTLSCRAGASASTARVPVRPALPGTAGAKDGLSDLLGAAQAELTGLQVVSLSPEGDAATMTVSLPHTTPGQAARALAAWMVAHATSMHVTAVRLADRAWTDHEWTAGAQPLPDGTVRVQVGR